MPEHSFVCSGLMTSIGYYGFLKLCEAASFNVAFSARKYHSTSQFLYDGMDIFLSEIRTLILHAIRKAYWTDCDGILEVGVSFDNNWMTRGHKTHANVGFVIECKTGFVLDFEVVSNPCIVCSMQK